MHLRDIRNHRQTTSFSSTNRSI